MKKVILILAIIGLFISCNKNSNKSSSITPATTPMIYCMFTEDGGTHIYRGCAYTQEDMQNMAVDLRNQGYTVVTNIRKNDCSECQ